MYDRPFPKPFPYRLPPFEHQREAMKRSAFEREYALLMEQGTGKSMVLVCTIAAQWYKGMISAAVIVAPKGVHTNWVTDELPKHMPEDVRYNVIHWRAGKMTSKHRKEKTRQAIADMSSLCVLVINVDALAHPTGKRLIQHIHRKRRTLFAVDESSDIATPSSDRTKAAIYLARSAATRRILNGTPGVPMKLWSQFALLDWRILGQPTYREYQLRWAEWNKMDSGSVDNRGRPIMFLAHKTTRDGKKVYKDLDELHRRVATKSYRVTKKECFDLPPKLYTTVYCSLNSEQRRMYAELVRDYETTFKGDGATVSVEIQLTLYLRLQQILCGYVPTDFADEDTEPTRIIEGPNYRLDQLFDWIEHQGDTHGIIWTRFKLDVQLIRAELIRRGLTFVEYHGDIKSDAVRDLNKKKFQNGDVQWWLGNERTGGKGLTLTAAQCAAYYSQYFGLETRLQTEDRCHRYGTLNPVTYADFVCEGTIDDIVRRALRNDREVADVITGDIPIPWI